MTRRSFAHAVAGAGAAALAAAQPQSSGPRWKLQYFYDRNQETFTINDFHFITARHGIAVGWVSDKNGKPKAMSVVTRDGGAKWDVLPLPDMGISTFFLNESLGWLVTEKGLWRTEEGGRDWKKLKLPKNTAVNRVYFHDEDRGWAVCQHKSVLETRDGGQTWSELEAAQKPAANPDYTSYNLIDFIDQTTGIIVGSSVPPRAGEARPAWVDPEAASKRREWPSLTITLETRDGGASWTSQTVPAFGQTVRLRMTANGHGLVLIRFDNAFEWPAEVYEIKPKGGSARVFRQKDRVVTDVGWLAPNRALLAAIEPPGRLAQLPIPGKLHILTSEDRTTWTEMKVDYRAFGTRAMFSILSPDLAWVATDTGQILQLAE